MRHCSLLTVTGLVAGLAGSGTVSAQADHGHREHIGVVRFPNSGAARAQDSFLRGIALLHSFVYEPAAQAFQQAERADSNFALPYWFEALTHSPVLWGIDDPAAARAVLCRLGSSAAARLAKSSPRERPYGAAVEAFYADTDLATRTRAFADSLSALAIRDPSDLEAAAFASVAIQMYLYKAPIAATERQRREAQAIAFADRVFRANPLHPGAAHYLIHVSDLDAAFAKSALPAALAYARIAPDVEHAQHMPSHVFLKLGRWDDQVASNERAWRASVAEVTNAALPKSRLDYHDFLWLQYGYLQQGRFRAARALIDSARRLIANNDTGSTLTVDAHYVVPMLEFAYARETGRWTDGPRGDFLLQPVGPLATRERERSFMRTTAFGRAVSALLQVETPSTGVVDSLAVTLGDTSGLGSLGAAQRLAVLELRAIVAECRHDRESAINWWRRAASIEDEMPPIGPPPLMRTHESLGALFLAGGEATAAIEQYESALVGTPNRSSALLGLARARAATGDHAGAALAYRQLLRNWQHADADLPDLAEARRGAGAGHRKAI